MSEIWYKIHTSVTLQVPRHERRSCQVAADPSAPSENPKPSQEKLLDAVVAGEGIVHRATASGPQWGEIRRKRRRRIHGNPARRPISGLRPRKECDRGGRIRNDLELRTRKQIRRPSRPAECKSPGLPERRDTSLREPKLQGQEQASPATRLRKRQIDGDGEEPELKWARLTQKNLARLDKMGKKGSNKAPTHSDSASESTTKTISTTSSGFAIRAHRNGILDPLNSKPPINLENIQEQHTRSRATASPPELRFKRYARTVSKAGNEATMVYLVSGHILKEYDDDGYQKAFNRAFTAFPWVCGYRCGVKCGQG